MAAIIAGPFIGAMVGGAMYYTISQTISKDANRLRSEIYTTSLLLSQASNPLLSGPSTTHPLPPSPTSLPPSSPPLGSLIEAKWNESIRYAVTSLATTDWSLVGKEAVGGMVKVVDVVGQKVGEWTGTGTGVGGTDKVMGGGTGVEAMPVARERRAVDRI